MKPKRKIGTFKGLAAIATVGLPLVFGSGCASTYHALPEPAKKVVRETPEILWPITWRDAVKDEERQKENVNRLPENVYIDNDGGYSPIEGYGWVNPSNHNDLRVAPIEELRQK